jgi:peptidyl-prolyl cis-trans isomerase B (cyclophilin B)
MKLATETQRGSGLNQNSFTQRRKGAKPPGTRTFLALRLCLFAPLREKSAQNTGFCVRGSQRANQRPCRAIRVALAGFIISTLAASSSVAQNPTPSTETLKKANPRPADPKPAQTDPFEGASVEKMTGQCVTLDTESGLIVIEMLPKAAPETARSFLNLAASGALDTTTFSRVVRDFVIQGGNLSTSEKWNSDLAKRMARHLPDEPSAVRHERGIVSMARTDEPNSATTHFFILVGDGPHLDGKFSAFGRVVRGLEVAVAINHAPLEVETPLAPVRIKLATVAPCSK